MSQHSLSNYKILSQRFGVSNADLSGLYLLIHPNKDYVLPHSIFIDSVKKDLLEFSLKSADVELISSSRRRKKLIKKTSFLEPQEFFGEEDYESYIFKISKLKSKELKNPILFKLLDKIKYFEFSCVSSSLSELNLFADYIEKQFGEVKDYDAKTNFGILLSQEGSTYIKEIEIEDKFSENLNLELNYGKKFTKTHESIVGKLKDSNKGLFLFHGTSGTGKTTYIKYLAKMFGGEKMFIFIPTSFIDALVSPNILPILLEKPNSVLVLEDAEKAVVSREDGMGNESLVSSLLNIGDGILGSMLNISIILTFNTSREKIDKALLRKGRLHYEYKFDELEIEDAQNLVSTFNKNYIVKKPMSLAEIYNLEHDNNHKEQERARIGFGI